MATQREETKLAFQVPQLDCFVGRTGSKEVAAGVEGAPPGDLAVTGQCQHTAATREIPEPHLQEERLKNQQQDRRTGVTVRCCALSPVCVLLQQ